jgi:hypothetical protein
MKNNTGQTKQLLEQALRALPDDFALQGARSSIIAALNHISSIEHKRQRRENTQKHLEKIQAQQPFNIAPLSPTQAKAAINGLEKLIQQELANIDARKSEKPKQSQTRRNFGNNDLQTFHG